MDRIINAVGLRCPMPIIETKKILDGLNSGAVVTIVDNSDAVENLSIFAINSEYGVESEEIDGVYHVTITKEEKAEIQIADNETSFTIVITTDCLGKGSDELGEGLMKGFIYSLTEVTPRPTTMIFMNMGVVFTTEGSPVKDSILAMQEMGVEILSCGTCLNYFGLSDKLIAGAISNMYTIAERISRANRVIQF